MTEAAGTSQRASTWTATRYASNGPVEIAYDQLAGSEGDPLLLVMGLAVSRFWWPAGLAKAFADRGFAVARYDQRDAGESTRMPDTGASNPFAALARKRGAYSSEDMTDDAIAVLDALGWERAHVFGASLGGIIAQRIALRHPDRVLSVVSAMAMPSDVSGIGGGRYVRFGLLARLARAKVPRGPGRRHPAVAHARPRARLPGLPVRRERGPGVDRARCRQRPRDTKAQSRQVGAPWHGPKLRELRKPVAGPARRPGPDPAGQRRARHGQGHRRCPPGDPARRRPRPARAAVAGDRRRGPPSSPTGPVLPPAPAGQRLSPWRAPPQPAPRARRPGRLPAARRG